MGYLLNDLGAGTWDATAAGFLVAVLLLWPIVFHGIDESINDRGWRLAVLYSSFIVLFAACSTVGYILSELISTYRSGGTIAYLLSQLPFVIIWPLVMALCLATFRFFAGKVRSRVADAWRKHADLVDDVEVGNDDANGEASFTIEEPEL